MLPNQNRLTQRSDFALIYKNGSYAACDGIAIKFLKTVNPFIRAGFPIGKSYSKKATDRNRMRRFLREATRMHLYSLKPGYDFVLMVNSGKNTLQFSETVIILRRLFIKANLFIKSDIQTKK